MSDTKMGDRKMAMPEMLRTREMAKRLGVTQENLIQTASKYGIPCYKEWFPPRNGRGKKETGWKPDQVIAWYKRTGRINDAGELINLRTGQLRKPKSGGSHSVRPPKSHRGRKPLRPSKPATPGEVSAGLMHLLGAFAFACEHSGIPHQLQEFLEAADLEQMNPDALEIIEEMALRHPRTEAQWILIKQALPTLIARAKAADPALPIKITIQAGPNMADQIDLKVIGYNTPDPGKGKNVQ